MSGNATAGDPADAPIYLFDTEPLVRRSAVVSDCGRYRYRLDRIWDTALPAVTFIMLNPSTADASNDDATIRRLAGTNGFARRWGCGALIVVNLYAWRATTPVNWTPPPTPSARTTTATSPSQPGRPRQPAARSSPPGAPTPGPNA